MYVCVCVMFVPLTLPHHSHADLSSVLPEIYCQFLHAEPLYGCGRLYKLLSLYDIASFLLPPNKFYVQVQVPSAQKVSFLWSFPQLSRIFHCIVLCVNHDLKFWIKFYYTFLTRMLLLDQIFNCLTSHLELHFNNMEFTVAQKENAHQCQCTAYLH